MSVDSKTETSRREFLKFVGGAGGAALATLIAGLGINEYASRQPSRREILTNPYSNEITEIGNGSELVNTLRNDYGILPDSDVAAIQINTAGKGREQRLSVFTVPPSGDEASRSRVFIQGEGEDKATELMRFTGNEQVSWYIPERVRETGRPKYNRVNQSVLTITNRDEGVFAIAYHPPDRETDLLVDAGATSEDRTKFYFMFPPEDFPKGVVGNLSK